MPLMLSLQLASCGGQGATHQQAEGSDAEGDTIPLRYARHLVVVERPGSVEAIIRNPWDTTQVLRHLSIAVPLRRAAIFSAVHCALLQELGVEDAIAGVCDLRYMRQTFVKEGVASGHIVDLGSGDMPDLERIVDQGIDALFPSPYKDKGGYGRLADVGIPIVECADYMETGPLARAEWMRFYGRLFGVGERADSIFREVEARYLAMQQLAQTAAVHHPALVCDLPISGQWYMPAGESTMGQIYRDAGAHYIFQHLDGSGSIPLSVEQVLERAITADVWLIKHHGPLSLVQITSDMPMLRAIKAKPWQCDTEQTSYYEETPFHPELLLAHLVDILHPELGVKAEKTYFCPMK